MSEKYALEINNLSYQYEKSKKLLKNVSFKIPEQSIVTILGKNGTGKTTLLNCILGFVEDYYGTIIFFGKVQTEYSRKSLAQIVGLVPQLSQVSFDYTVEEFVLMGCNPALSYFSIPGKTMYSRVDEALKTLEITHLRNRRVNSLSGGERQLASIARTLAQHPKIIILDDPTSAVDFGNSMKITDLLIKLRNDGFTIILTCHNPDYPFLFHGYTVAMLPDSKIVFGKSEEILTDQVLSKLYGVQIKRVYLPECAQYVCVKNLSH